MKTLVRRSWLGVLVLLVAFPLGAGGAMGAPHAPSLTCPETILAGQTITCELTGGEAGVEYHIHAEVTVKKYWMDDMEDDFGYAITESPASLEIDVPEDLGYTQGSFFIGYEYLGAWEEVRVRFRIGLPEGHPDLALDCQPEAPLAGDQVQCEIVGAVPFEWLGVEVRMKRSTDDWAEYVDGWPQEMDLVADQAGYATFSFLLPSDAEGEVHVLLGGRRGWLGAVLPISSGGSAQPRPRAVDGDGGPGEASAERPTVRGAGQSAEEAEPSVTVERPTRIDAGGGGTASY